MPIKVIHSREQLTKRGRKRVSSGGPIQFTLNAAVGTFTLTGGVATFLVKMALGAGSFGETGGAANLRPILGAQPGSFFLTGGPAQPEFTPPQAPMALIKDAWDVDEWGRFFKNGAVRRTL